MTTQIRRDRESLDPQTRDISTWPHVDITALDAKAAQLFARRSKAVSLYLKGERLASIIEEVGFTRQEIHRLVRRCLKTHADGRIWGYRALLPGQRQKPYQRTTRVTGARGSAGALMQLFDRFPGIRERVDKLFLKK